MSEQRALTIPAGGKLAPITPTSFDDVARMAKLCVMAGMFQGRGKDNDDDSKPIAQATMAIMQGLECGIPPMQAVQQIAVINGRCTIWGDLVPALIWSRGHEIDEWIEGDGDDRIAHCKIKRGDSGKVIERTFSVKQAIKAGLWDTRKTVKRKYDGAWKDVPNDNPWFKYDERMLQMRARGFCSRDAVPDVLRGMYLREEVEEEREVRDITPHVAPEPPAPPAPPAPPDPLAIEDQTPPEFNVAAFMANLEDELCACQDIEALGECWAQSEVTMEDHLDRNQRDEALDVYKKHEARITGQTDLEAAIASQPVSDMKAGA